MSLIFDLVVYFVLAGLIFAVAWLARRVTYLESFADLYGGDDRVVTVLDEIGEAETYDDTEDVY